MTVCIVDAYGGATTSVGLWAVAEMVWTRPKGGLGGVGLEGGSSGPYTFIHAIRTLPSTRESRPCLGAPVAQMEE